MSFRSQWHRDKLRKKVERGFRGYPLATLAYYGPTDQRASKLVAAIFRAEGADPDPIRKWHSGAGAGDVRSDSEIIEELAAHLQEQNVKSVVAVDRIIGCPHEEGIDYPEGAKCPSCPFWENRDRFAGQVSQ